MNIIVTEIRIREQKNRKWELSFWQKNNKIYFERDYRTAEIAMLLAPISLERFNDRKTPLEFYASSGEEKKNAD